MKTTLNRIRAHHPCRDGWEKLLRHLNKTRPDDEPLPLEEVLDSNGFSDALWCLRAVEGHDREMWLYSVWCARQVQRLMTDPRSVAALDVAERYARGQASREELKGAREAAWEAAWEASTAVAVWAARPAAEAAAAVAVWAAWETAPAASKAARESARESAAARTAAWAESAAARAAARAESAAARAAAWVAAWEASTAGVARAAAAKEQAAIDAQVTELRRVCREIDAGRDPYPLEAKP